MVDLGQAERHLRAATNNGRRRSAAAGAGQVLRRGGLAGELELEEAPSHEHLDRALEEVGDGVGGPGDEGVDGHGAAATAAALALVVEQEALERWVDGLLLPHVQVLAGHLERAS